MLSINKAQVLQDFNLNLDGYPFDQRNQLKAATKNWLSIDQEDSNTSISQNQPLKDLVVYVEMMTNGDNVSDASYGYLTKLGAKIEKRLTKKCNLVIWKDGALKTVEKAKELGATVVNSLWLDECCQNCYCAPFDKFLPKLPNEMDLPFLVSLESRKKKRTFESMGSRSSINEKGSAKKLGAVQKKRKSNPEDAGVNPFVTPFDTLESVYKTEDFNGGSIFDRINLGRESLFNRDKMQQNPPPSHSAKNIIAKYSRSVTLEEKEDMVLTKENSPEDKTKMVEELPSFDNKDLSEDTISMSEAYLYHETTGENHQTPPKTDLNQILTKYLPSKTLEPDQKYTSPPFKTNSQDDAEFSTIEKSSLLAKYLEKTYNNPSTPKTKKEKPHQQTFFDSGIKESNPLLSKGWQKNELENKTSLTANPIKSSFLRRDQNDESRIKKNVNFDVTQVTNALLRENPKKLAKQEKKTICFANLSQEGLKLARSFCTKFNFEFIDNLSKLDISKLDYIVYEGDEIPKTYITALAMLKGKPIIKREWMQTSLEENSLDDSDIYEHYYNPQSRKKLFSTLKFFIDEEFEKPIEGDLSKGKLVTLIEQAGGDVFAKPKVCSFIIIRKGRHALALAKGYAPNKIRTNEWIIDTIIKGSNVKPNV